MNDRRHLVRFAVAALIAAVTAAGTLSGSAAAEKAPVNVGLIASKTGLLGAYGVEYSEAFRVGLDYATHGTGLAGGHKIVVSEVDDATDPAKSVAAAKDLIGQQYKIILSVGSSASALQLAPLAKENNVLYISGGAASDAITGINRNTFRSGRQTFQDVVAVGAYLGSNLRGKHVLVLAQDSVFGGANVAIARSVLGGAEGAAVSGLLVPLQANDFTPFAQKVVDAKPDLLYIAWAGATGGALVKSLEDANVFAATPVVTGLDQRAGFPLFGMAGTRIKFISHYVPEAPHNKVNDFLIAALKKNGKVPEVFAEDGFAAAEMVVHAIETADGDDPQKLITALEGWSFVAPKGDLQIRAADHAMLQPMFLARLVKNGDIFEPVLVRALPPPMLAPPVKAFK
ncbi:MAG: substrate-binding domain-containing protein [Candidatus Velthaea sp.]